jgi:Tfp pilus assembly protein PilN
VCLGTLIVYENHPFSMDEYAALFQARVFALGQTSAHLPAPLLDWLIVPGFNGMFLIASHASGHVIEGYWPGFALLLTPFVLLGAPWLCNALLAGLGLWLIHRLTLEITGERGAAGWAVLFAAGSGVFLANAISYYSMQAHLTLNLLYAWLLFRPTGYRALAAGFVGSVALILHNPFPHALFALPWIVALALDGKQRRLLLPLVLGYLPLLAVAVGWLLLRFHIAAAPSQAATLASLVAAVFQWPDQVLFNMRVASTVKLLVWAVPGLLLFVILGAWRSWDDRRVRLLALSAVMTFCGYLFVKLDQGHGWGYRYFHSAWGVLPVLAGCAMTRLGREQDRLVCFAGAAAVLSLLLIVPVQMFQIHAVIAAQQSQLGAALRPGNNVYFLNPMRGFYLSDLIQIDPGLRDPDLLLLSHGADANEALVRANWPEAVKEKAGDGVEHWYLGPQEQRRAPSGGSGPLHFEIKPPPDSQP